ncbi:MULTISPECIES: hypothetical protein [Rahnella]|jgi:hypothetical protein|uniref:Uncharacterized protein n=1 Tax=Rahnella laticis TaxID=2787622 RepID=A0ABS0E4V7_9GAMM|nr:MULTISPECIES: hypothetical protein [Rahnella]MBF7980120.1 hypothetical protein [Rahnella laticis]MBF8000621.1 hypothetical protein [Rahnella sp. LAC-M12]MBU9822029.1 hypothetical protein [Rahnella sp. BCC 1045]MBV6819366.1 hypothetical protein [Rahnella sp. PD12R]MCS3423024.1 hypothetical protein [Rahnella sp. BIGb0603]
MAVYPVGVFVTLTFTPGLFEVIAVLDEVTPVQYQVINVETGNVIRVNENFIRGIVKP